MTLEPLLTAPLAVQVHVFTVVPAFVLGSWLIFFSAKGARYHRAVGYLYLGLVTITAITALFIHSLMPKGPFGGFSPIHLLVLVTLFGVANAIYGARTHDIKRHRRAMLTVYIGGMLVAGGFTFLPGRIMHAIVFGG